MEENGCMSKRNMSKDYKNGGRSTNKGIINCKICPLNHHAHACRENTHITCNHQDSFGTDNGRDNLVSDFSWPPRFYTCTFCKREFRSAQALGGHMNVHRREKARLRQITPPRYLSFLPPQPQNFTYNSKFLTLNPNPNPSISTCLSSSENSLHPFSVNLNTMRSQKSDLTLDGFEEFSHDKEYITAKKSEKGSLTESKFNDLDLELRLGCS